MFYSSFKLGIEANDISDWHVINSINIHCPFFLSYFTLFWAALLSSPEDTSLQDKFFNAIMTGYGPVGEAYKYLKARDHIKEVLIKTQVERYLYTWNLDIFYTKSDRWGFGGMMESRKPEILEFIISLLLSPLWKDHKFIDVILSIQISVFL